MTAYWIVRVTVTDSERYAEYAERAGAAVGQFGGKFHARGGTCVTKEGRERLRNVIVEFPTFDEALACYDSPAYQDAMSYQKGAADRDFCIVEGV